MGFIKRKYKDQETLITAENMNAIQDAILDLEDGLFSVDNDKSGEVIAITDAANRGFRSLNIYGKTTQRTTTGKNLYKTNLSHYTYNKDGTFTIIPGDRLQSGPTAHLTGAIPAGTYTLTFFEGTGIIYIKRATDDYSTSINVGGSKTFEYDGTSYLALICSDVAANATPTYKIQLERGSASTAFEPYTGGEAAPNPDHPQELVSLGDGGSICVNVANETEENVQALTVFTPNGLPGIPVTAGGNYTDANGKRWICDEIDLAKGVYVQRVKKAVLDGTNYELVATDFLGAYLRCAFEKIGGKIGGSSSRPGFYSHGKYLAHYTADSSHAYAEETFLWVFLPLTNADEVSNYLAAQYAAGTPVSVLYQLTEAVETPLSEEELSAYFALHTYKDLTTVSNDAGAWMELEYAMDAKRYIDSLVISSGGSVARLSSVILRSSAWTGENGLYSQVVTIDGITEYSKVDLLPSVEQLAIFHNKDVAFVTENENGIVTVYAIGDKPTLDYTIQVQITEVVV